MLWNPSLTKAQSHYEAYYIYKLIECIFPELSTSYTSCEVVPVSSGTIPHANPKLFQHQVKASSASFYNGANLTLWFDTCHSDTYLNRILQEVRCPYTCNLMGAIERQFLASLQEWIPKSPSKSSRHLVRNKRLWSRTPIIPLGNSIQWSSMVFELNPRGFSINTN